jgi:F-type H+-transporting ATPase subunit gamma
MPSLKAIRKRIGSVKNTQKITRAMKLVAAARLRRAQDSIIAARPYSAALERVVAELADRAGRDAHPLLAERPGKRAEVVLLTSDRGLAGSYNAQVLRRSEGLLGDELSDWDEVGLRIIGRKGNEFFKRRNGNIMSYVSAPTSVTALDVSRELANHVVDDFLKEKTDRVYLIYSEFKSAMTQTPVIRRQNGIYRASLESIASELGARMSAMDSATRNAGEMIDRLTLQYNRARQAAITKELLEIIGGAEALKG